MAATRRPGRPKKAPAIAQTPESLSMENQPPDHAADFGGVFSLDLTLDDGTSMTQGAEFFNVPMGLDEMNGALSLANTRNSADPGGLDLPLGDGSMLCRLMAEGKELKNPSWDMHQCFKELSELNVDLHAQMNAIRERSSNIGIGVYICIDSTNMNQSGFTFAERALTAVQKFHDIITRVEWLLCQRPMSDGHRDLVNHDVGAVLFDGSLNFFPEVSPTGLPSPESISGTAYTDGQVKPPKLEMAVVLVVISCYVQLVNIFFDICDCLQKYLKTLDKNETIPAIDSVRFFQMGSFCVSDGRLQGLMFCTIVTHYLDRLERILGLLPSHRRQSVPIQHVLLDRPQYRELLEKELEDEGITGCTSPKKLRDTVENLRRVLLADPSW